MCGILGRITPVNSTVNYEEFTRCMERLYRLSESRGKEASGLCCMTSGKISVLKADVAASKLIKGSEFKNTMAELTNSKYRFAMGHSRMITNGDSSDSNNNQPVVRGNLVVVHNGIIVNDGKLWEKHSELKRTATVDTEILLALLEEHKYEDDFIKAFKETIKEIEGSISIALVERKSNWAFLYTNIGSLYVAVAENDKDYIFASERYILEETIKKHVGSKAGENLEYSIRHIAAGEGLFINVQTGEKYDFPQESCSKSFDFVDSELFREINISGIVTKTRDKKYINLNSEREQIQKMLDINLDAIHKMRRCTKCLLPETFPGIKYDEHGVCSICNSYKKKEYTGKDALIKDLTANKNESNRYDCIAPLSGGRDSCYILHYLVKELNLKPVAYTYDWGLVTDLARRNIQRMCAALGVEHILISADISKKRDNVRKNVEAWLKKPELGTVPLFMAGDKQFFYYAQLLKRQMKVDSVVFGMNSLEETQFKARFIGLNADKKNDMYSNFSSKNKMRLALGYGKEFLKNPAYFNSSLVDSFTGFLSYYALPQSYFRFFDYIEWNQEEIEKTLINQYDWETSDDSNETWRIGDGTAPFYNYIYYRMAGFTEFDTFKSNQIREGMLSREEAMKQIDESNRISIDGFLWYCHTIGIDPIRAIKIINSQKPLYEKMD